MDTAFGIVTTVIHGSTGLEQFLFALTKHLSRISYRRLLGFEGSLNSTNVAPHVYIMSFITRLNNFFSASVNLLAVYTNRGLLHSLQSIIKPVLLVCYLAGLNGILCPRSLEVLSDGMVPSVVLVPKTSLNSL